MAGMNGPALSPAQAAPSADQTLMTEAKPSERTRVALTAAVTSARPRGLRPSAAGLMPVGSVADGVLQRCGASPCAGGCSHDDELPVRRQAAPGSARPSSLPPVVRDALPSPGRPLEAGVRAYFEPRFGRDFGAVRVHTDEHAARAADAVDALAFTVGNSIWFGRDMYQPGAAAGRRLLAHELAHTIQQRGRPVAPQALRLGAPGDAAEAAADRLADAVTAGEPVPDAGASDPVIRRAPKVSPVPGNPSQRIVDMDDGSRYRVTRNVGLQPPITTEGEDPGPSAEPMIDMNNVWLQIEWCTRGGKRDIHGKVSVGTDLPAAAQVLLHQLADAINNGADPAEVIRKAELSPFAEVSITQSERFTAALKAGPTVQVGTGKVTGGKLEGTLKLGGMDIYLQGGVGESATGSGRPDFNVTGGIRGTWERVPKVVCKRTYVLPKIDYQCEKIVPEHKVPDYKTHRESHYFYFEYAKSEFARTGRTAALDAQAKAIVKQLLASGYSIENIRGYASPEGPRPAGPGFQGNDQLSRERVTAAENWVKGVCQPSPTGSGQVLHPEFAPRVIMEFPSGQPGSLRGVIRPGCFVQGYGSVAGSELYGGPKDAELKGKELAESSVKAFETEPAEQERRTPDVMKELEKKKTPERQTDTVWPLLRRAEIDLIRVDTDEKTVPESITPVACPVEVIKAVADAFEAPKKH